MENKNLQFVTNINCSGCVAKVTPFLNDAEGIGHWEVDTTKKEKVLSVTSRGITEEQVLTLIEKSGFKAAPLVP